MTPIRRIARPAGPRTSLLPFKGATAVLALIACLIAGLAARESTVSARQTDDPVVVQVESSTGAVGAQVTLTFSRRVDYRMRETRSRLRLSLFEPVDEASRVDQRLSSDVVRRVRFDRTRRGMDIVFHLGRGFENFSLSELGDPFRVVLMFHGGSALPAVPDEDTLPRGIPGVVPGGPEDVPQLPEARGRRFPGAIGVVILDPGHGGGEDGAVSPDGLKEKELVLDIARKARSLLDAAGYSVALTRDYDQPVDLSTRTALANHMQADLFISIHANSSIRTPVRGPETYFLSYAASDDDAKSVAAKENRSGAAGTGGGFEREIELVLWEMAQTDHLARSSRLAELIQAELNRLADTRDRGVKQAPFRVLVGASMPAVLVEVGFLTNPGEEKLLASQDYRHRIAESIARAVGRFEREMMREARNSGSGRPGGGQ